MLDLLISYINFLILSISYIVKRFTFFPPDPPHYISIKTENEDEEDILFLIHHKKKKVKYIGIEFRHLDYKFIKIIDKNNNSLPLLLLNPPEPLPVCIIYSHGNSGDLGSCLIEYYDIAMNTNCIVVSFEYPGYGELKNQELRESNFYRNLKMTYYFVRKILKYKPNQIILYGFSLGTGIMFEIACKKEYPAAGLILQSPFLSIMRTLYNIKRTPFCDLFNSCDKAKSLCIKTFFIHGNKDRMVPYIHGRILAKLIPQKYFYKFLTVPNADHNNMFKINKELIYTQIRQFIKDCTGYYCDFTIKEKKDDKNGKDVKKDKEKIRKPAINEINKQNRSDEIKRPTVNFNINNNFSGLKAAFPYYNDLRPLANIKPNFNDNLFKNYFQVNYPINYMNNLYNFQNQNFLIPINYNSQIFDLRNSATNVPILNNNLNNLYNNRIFIPNKINDYSINGISRKMFNTEENVFNNSSINDLNNIL
jgi:predicted esterase